jgi:alpha-L-rhamnosidase
MGIEIMITEGEVDVSYVGVTEYCYSAKKMRSIKIDDPELALVYEAAKASFRHNAVDIFMDCPSRERAGWLCDSYYEGKSEYYFTGTTMVENEFLNNYLLGGGARADLDGMVEMCYPATATKHIPQWSMWYVLELYDYFTKRGRGDRKDDFKAQLYRLLDYFKKFENEFGLLEKLPSWNFVEWSKLNQRVHDVSWPTNMLFSEAVECIGKLYGDEALLKKAADLRKTINDMAWNGKMYMDRAMRQEDGSLKNTEELSETTQYYAFRYGLADINEERCAYLKDMVFNVFGKDVMAEKCPEIEPSNSLPGFYIRTELMMQWKMYPELIEYIKHFFLPMAQATGTLWENKTPGASCDHGFASFIAIAIEEIQNNK